MQTISTTTEQVHHYDVYCDDCGIKIPYGGRKCKLCGKDLCINCYVLQSYGDYLCKDCNEVYTKYEGPIKDAKDRLNKLISIRSFECREIRRKKGKKALKDET